jgi:glutathione synthase/RimK-type ligase-like ATP-grasp enzyme
VPLLPKTLGDEAEEQHVAGEWTEALEGFLAHIPRERWINHPAANAHAAHKLEQLTRARQFELAIPVTLLTQSAEEALAFWQECGGCVVVKPLSSGYLERLVAENDTQVFTSAVTQEDINSFDLVTHCPTLFQKRIDKSYDVRATIIDDFSVFVKLVATDRDCQRLDIRRNNMEDVKYSPVEPPEAIRSATLALIRSYGLRFAAIDFAIDKFGNWVFLEINPNGQWAWLDLIGRVDIASGFIGQVTSIREK